jgi:lipopolysaccharide transport system permease protein
VPTLLTDTRALFEETLLLDPARARERWLTWRSQIETDDFDGDVVLHLPLLNARLADWASLDDVPHPDQARLAGICKRGWAQNQLRFGKLAELWALLQAGGAAPIAFTGCAAWALVYQQEQSVRPIASFEILVDRRHARLSQQLLEAAGWTLEPDMPQPLGRALDHYEGLWFNDGADLALHLTWRLRQVSPELAAENESLPSRIPHELRGVAAFTLSAEELLANALTRHNDTAVSWQCDAVVLLRNQSIDWKRIHTLLRGFPETTARLQRLSTEFTITVPQFVFDQPRQNYIHRRLSTIWTNSRQVAWKNETPHTIGLFLRYAVWRLGHSFVYLANSNTAVTVIEPSSASAGTKLAEYARYRAFFVFLAMRDVRLRYKRTWRGILWALVQPLLPMLIFAAIFARVIRPELQHGPYWLFVLAGLAPWNFFANAVNYASATFVSNLNLVSKVYFPRAILPLAAVAACGVDLLVATTVLLPVCFYMGYHPTLGLLALPAVLLAAMLIGAVVGTAAASLNVLHRDLKPLVPFLVQVCMYATPVLYPVAMIPRAWRPLVWINPMTAIVEAFRAIIFHSPLNWLGVAVSIVSFGFIALIALWLFTNVEADIAERV